MKVMVIVVTYNGEKWIDKCFGSLKESSIPLQLLAIDNASSDNTISLIKNRFPEVEIIETGANLGFGKANNIGLRKALEENADYVFLLNQDAWVERDTIKNLVETASKNPEYGIISPFHFNWDKSKVDHYFLMMVNPNDCPDYLSDCFLKKERDIYSVNFIHAACWLVSKECILDTGGFDPLFYHYGEDNDYVDRAKSYQFKIGISPSSNVYHDGRFDLSKEQNDNFRFRQVSALIELKTLNNKLIANYFFFFKSRFDRFTSLFFSKRFKNAFKELKLAGSMTKYWSRIKKSRKQSKQPKAFL